jgi:hypothetical protein
MLSPHIVSALLAQREADLRQRAELARLRHPEQSAAEVPLSDPTWVCSPVAHRGPLYRQDHVHGLHRRQGRITARG